MRQYRCCSVFGVLQCVAVCCSVLQCVAVCCSVLRQYRVAKTHRMPYLDGTFSAKETYDWWLVCRKRPATSDILCIFATQYLPTVLNPMCV